MTRSAPKYAGREVGPRPPDSAACACSEDLPLRTGDRRTRVTSTGAPRGARHGPGAPRQRLRRAARRAALGVAVAMGDREPTIGTTFEGQPARVHGAVMARAQDDEVLRLVSAPVEARAQVVDVQPLEAAAAGNFAAPSRPVQEQIGRAHV